MRRVPQLSFDVFAGGGIPRDAEDNEKRPLATTISVSGSFDLTEAYSEDRGMPELAQGETVLVQVSTLDGELITHGHGEVEIGFKNRNIAGRRVTVRTQKVKL
jgi:hypothetical protein